MLHSHKFPPEVIKGAIEEARNTGEELPEYVTNAPVLRLGSALFLNAWFELDYERNRVKLQSIPRSVVWQYATDYELDDSQREDLWFYISRMDRDFMEWYIPHLEAHRNANSRGFGQ